MITTRLDSGEKDDIIMYSTDGEGVPLQIGENPNFEKGEASPLIGATEMDPHRTRNHKTRDMKRQYMTKITPRCL